MSKLQAVVVMVMLVLTGAIGLRNIVSNAGTASGSGVSIHSTVWADGPGPIPPLPPAPRR